MTRKTKTISFNLISEYDSRLLEYAERAERGSFSKYIKRLIDRDMNSTQRSVEWNQAAADSGQVPDDDGLCVDVENTVNGFL